MYVCTCRLSVNCQIVPSADVRAIFFFFFLSPPPLAEKRAKELWESVTRRCATRRFDGHTKVCTRVNPHTSESPLITQSELHPALPPLVGALTRVRHFHELGISRNSSARIDIPPQRLILWSSTKIVGSLGERFSQPRTIKVIPKVHAYLSKYLLLRLFRINCTIVEDEMMIRKPNVLWNRR